MANLKKIQDQVVVVMGASSGIGRLAALEFARRGAKVVVSARGEAKLQSLVQEITAAGGSAVAVVADVAEWDAVNGVADRAVAEFGRIDTWVHAAGVGLWAAFTDVAPHEWKRILEVNLVGAGYGAMAALPHLKAAGGGALIQITSSEARIAMPLQAGYAAAKHGAHGFLKSLRMELERESPEISVTEIMPSGTNTPIFSSALTRIGVKPKPPGFMYQPEVVVNAILHSAEHATPEIIVGSSSAVMLVAQSLMPPVTDTALRAGGFWTQRTDEVKSGAAPSNLFEPLEHEDRVHGDFDKGARDSSVYAWLEMHPVARNTLHWGMAATGLVLALSWLGKQRRA